MSLHAHRSRYHHLERSRGWDRMEKTERVGVRFVEGQESEEIQVEEEHDKKS